LNIIKRSFVVSPESFVYDELHDKYIYTSRPDTRPLHEDGDRGKNNGQVSAFDPELSEINSADVVSQNFGFCEEARGTEIVGDRLFVAAMGQVCVFNTTTYEQLDSIGCCGASSAFDTHFLQGITWDPVRKMLWVTDLGAREQEVHNTGDDSDKDSGVTFDLNGKELIAAIDFKSLNDDGTYEIRKTLGFSSTDSDSDSFSRTGEDPLDRTFRFHPNGIVVDPKTGIIYVANTIVKTQEDDEGENEYASIWTCLPLERRLAVAIARVASPRPSTVQCPVTRSSPRVLFTRLASTPTESRSMPPVTSTSLRGPPTCSRTSRVTTTTASMTPTT